MPVPDPPMTTRSDAERNRRALLDAAADALARDPGASMAEVARAALLTRATLYRHFSTRQKLLEAMRAELLRRATEAIAGARLDEGDALEALRRAVDALVPLGLRFRALLREGADQEPAFLHAREEMLAPLHGVVRRGQEAGLIRPDLPAEWVAASMTALLAAGVRMWPVPRAGGASLADLVFGTLVDGITTGR